MQCKRCSSTLDLTPIRAESLRRFRAFSALALVLAASGVIAHLFGSPLWPYVLYAIALFVESQALLKWLEARWVWCRSCNKGYTYFGRIE